MLHYRLILAIFISCSCFAVSVVAAVQRQEVTINIKNHLFEPAEIIIPTDTVVRLIICNQDATVEEFESIDLKREKIVPANGKVVVSVGPLKAGTYKFFGEFHPETAQGIILVK